MMGAGIACQRHGGIEVVLIDSSQRPAERGRSHSAGLLDKAISRGKSTARKDRALSRIAPTTDYAALQAAT